MIVIDVLGKIIDLTINSSNQKCFFFVSLQVIWILSWFGAATLKSCTKEFYIIEVQRTRIVFIGVVATQDFTTAKHAS